VGDYFNRLFKFVEQESEGFETALAKTIKHGSTNIVGHICAAEGGAPAAGLILLVNHQHQQAALRKQAGGSQPAQAGTDHNDIVAVGEFIPIG